ncbi:MAG: PSD1 domain-containing protein [Verrucomicrobiales bacterium]|nr:PSD1 domain-containing protein [Verrucomicrobiales bacterium]
MKAASGFGGGSRTDPGPRRFARVDNAASEDGDGRGVRWAPITVGMAIILAGMRAGRDDSAMNSGISRFVLWTFLGSVAGAANSSSAATPSGPASSDFNRDIRPLFAKHCTACHGGVKAAGKISFVYREQAMALGKSGKRAILPGDPEGSELMRRVTSTDPDERMPQPDHGPALTEGEVAMLRNWIREGAKWSEHWSFVPPQPPAEPKVRDNTWSVTPADRFVLARLEAEGWKPSAEASPAEWLRRVTLDLIGLPPTPKEFEAYLEDRRDNARRAKEKVVDRLLDSPRFGERWAAMWLDLARYSDTYGFEKDPHRDIWPWRDWVIRAFNADMPFDEFTIKQLAGDLLERPTADDLLATAFHRNTQNNTEGGTDDEEYRTVAVHDRVNTTWTAWQATTFGCAQCHAHPYDPIPQRDYYRFAAFYDNTEDCDQNDDFPRLLFSQDLTRRDEVTRWQLEARDLRQLLNMEGLAAVAGVSDWQTLVPTNAKASGGQLTVGDDARIRASGTLPVKVTYTLTLPAIQGLTALRLDIFPETGDPKAAPERGQVLSKIAVSLSSAGVTNQPVALQELIADYLAGPFDAARVIDSGGGFGSYPVQNTSRRAVVVLAKPLEAPADATLEITIDHGIASNSGVQGCPLRHFALAFTKDTRLSAFASGSERQEKWKSLQSLKDRLKDQPGTRVPILVERSQPARRDTRVFVRGNRATRDEAVTPGIPDVVVPPKKEGDLSRLDMARWLVGDANPLAARVLANRLWAEMFGRGIVETLEDFGTSGARPTHPELLDHLALRLRGEWRWSIKRFLREIALSATYGQSAIVTADLAERDPFNQWYARGPRVRLTAEMVRDQALALSGTLSTKSYGPPVYPPQPDGVWSTVYSGDKWNTSQDADRFRRAIYTYQKRTSGYPVFLTFDAPTRDACTARRLASNTPLQALTVLNDPAFIEMAQSFANRMEVVADTPAGQIQYACRLLTLEPPPRSVVDALLKLYQGSLDEFRSDPASADKLAPTPERAALVLVANTLLNLDLALTR